MPPEERFLPRFAAEPPQAGIPAGLLAERLSEQFLAACLDLEDPPEDLGQPGEIQWYPDRSWYGRTYLPATALTSGGYELFGFVCFLTPEAGAQPAEFSVQVDYTAETAEQNPDWKLDLCDEVIGSWRGEQGQVAAMTLIWGRPLTSGGAVVTAELAGLTVDQCLLGEGRFTLIAPDDYGDQLLEVKLYDASAQALASESLYAPEEEDEDDGDEA